MSSRLSFPVEGDQVVGRHVAGVGDAFVTPAGRPCVVMAHGFGATRDSGLDEYAGALAAEGLDVLGFDYRHFGESEGQPRQLLSVRRQLADYEAAIAIARTLPDVDPGRIVLWGTSLSGGHVLRLAVKDRRVAAVIALTPSTDGRASAAYKVRHSRPAATLARTGLGILDAVRRAANRPPVLVGVTGPDGDGGAALDSPGVHEGWSGVTGPSWRNEFSARTMLAVGFYRPVRTVDQIGCPVLVQIADDDQIAPPRPAERAAEKARAEVRHYPCDHIDVYPGHAYFEPALAHQLFFLRRHLGR